jgi:uncharacterized repeat protein (TIGR01451 family)
MTTTNEMGCIAARPRRVNGWLAGLTIGLLLIGGCDEEDNNWKSAVPGDSPDVSLALAVDLRGSGAAHERQPLDYVLTARNLGEGEATAVVVADTLPAAVVFQSAAASQGAYDPDTGLWSLGALAPGASDTLVLSVVVVAGTRGESVVNGASVAASEPADPQPGNDRTSITFTVVNAPPTAAPDSYTVPEGGTLTVPAPGILGNDSDAEGESVTLDPSPVAPPSHGTLSLFGNGAFIYIHSGDDASTDTFRYVIRDASAEPDTGYVTIAITPVNDPPVLQSIPPQTIVEGELFANLRLDEYVDDPDDPDDTLAWTASGATALVVIIGTERRATITQPNDDWSGQETVTFRVADPGGLVAQRAVTFTVTPVNDAPVVGNIPDQATTPGGSFLPIPLDDYVFDVDNPDAQMLWTFSGSGPLIVTIGANRVATVSPPSPGWTGQVTITFRCTDPGGLWDYDTAQFTVAPAR